MARILVVDDEMICVSLLATALREEGHEVSSAMSGEEALDVGGSYSPDILISDWKLGGKVDGVELARTLQAKNDRLLVILFSGLPADELKAKAEGVRLVSVLEKPCELDELLSCTESALKSRQTDGPTIIS